MACVSESMQKLSFWLQLSWLYPSIFSSFKSLGTLFQLLIPVIDSRLWLPEWTYFSVTPHSIWLNIIFIHKNHCCNPGKKNTNIFIALFWLWLSHPSPLAYSFCKGDQAKPIIKVSLQHSNYNMILSDFSVNSKMSVLLSSVWGLG